MNRREVTRAITGLTASSIITVDIEGEKHAVLIREKQRNYMRDELIHIDFQAVSLEEKIRSKIEITLTGSAPAVKNFDGIVLQDKEFIEVEALPNDLPERITVDISNLQKIGDLIRVSDLTISDKVTVFDDSNETIVTISGTASDMAEEETNSREGSEPEEVEKGKKNYSKNNNPFFSKLKKTASLFLQSFFLIRIVIIKKISSHSCFFDRSFRFFTRSGKNQSRYENHPVNRTEFLCIRAIVTD